MALLHTNFFSDALGMASSMDVILPEATGNNQIGMENGLPVGLPPCLYLLHGLSDDHTIWQRRTAIERYVAPLGIAVIMPNVHRSFYTDMVHGYAYWTYISEELPAKVATLFRVSTAREDTFVAGLSMGGYGAFKLALGCPERFAAAASLSGVLNMAGHASETGDDRLHDLDLVYGSASSIAGSDNDLMTLAERVASRPKAGQPHLFQCCGTEDFLYQDNTCFRDYAKSLGLPLTYEEEPGGHEWGFWDRWIQRVLAWLPLRTQ